MAVALRLMRFGKKHYPTYRIIAMDKKSKRDGAYIEKVGTYNPMRDPAELSVNAERFLYWQNNGAQVSDGVRKLLPQIGKLVKPETSEEKPKQKSKAAPAKDSSSKAAPKKKPATTKKAAAK